MKIFIRKSGVLNLQGCKSEVKINDSKCLVCHEELQKKEEYCKCKNNHFVHFDCHRENILHCNLELKKLKCIYCCDIMLNVKFIYE